MLDTNTCVRYLNGRSPAVFERLDSLAVTDIAVCSVVKFELRYGAVRSDYPEKTLREQEKFLSRFVSLPFDDLAQFHAATLRATLSNAGTPIGPYDLMIAAIAIAHDLTLVTHNTREFSRVRDLAIDDWEAADSQ